MKITHPLQNNEDTVLAAQVGGEQGKDVVHFYEDLIQQLLKAKTTKNNPNVHQLENRKTDCVVSTQWNNNQQ